MSGREFSDSAGGREAGCEPRGRHVRPGCSLLRAAEAGTHLSCQEGGWPCFMQVVAPGMWKARARQDEREKN